ncbi:MAG: hypothetical protein U1F49_03640 [Rubrivivax sp.]
MAAAAAASMPSLSSVSFRKPVLAWSIAAEDEERFRRITRRVLAVVLLLAVILPFVPKPELETQRAQELPAPLARLLLERQATPPAPPPPRRWRRPTSRRPT